MVVSGKMGYNKEEIWPVKMFQKLRGLKSDAIWGIIGSMEG